MTNQIIRFYSSIKDAGSLNDGARVELFVYFLTELSGLESASVRQLDQCFRECDLTIPKSTAQILSRGLSSKPKKYVKANVGYKLERHRREFLASSLGAETHTVQIPSELQNLGDRLPNGPGKEWFKEAMDCFGVEAYRAALIMMWLFTLDHLFAYILKHKILDFNNALVSHPDQRSVKKVGQIKSRDDFSPLGEELFLDICKTAKIISLDVRRILGVTLGVRNSAAHPSGVTITRSKFITVTEDIVLNVVLKYKI